MPFQTANSVLKLAVAPLQKLFRAAETLRTAVCSLTQIGGVVYAQGCRPQFYPDPAARQWNWSGDAACLPALITAAEPPPQSQLTVTAAWSRLEPASSLILRRP